jgi:hypothetical protein
VADKLDQEAAMEPRRIQWTITGDPNAVAGALDRFCARQNMSVQRPTADAWTIERGAELPSRRPSASLQPRDALSVRGSIVRRAGDRGSVLVDASFGPGARVRDRGVVARHPAGKRFDSMIDELFCDLEASLPGARA